MILLNYGASSLTRAKGETITLSAKGSFDPDDDLFTFRWFLYKEAGRYTGNFELADLFNYRTIVISHP